LSSKVPDLASGSKPKTKPGRDKSSRPLLVVLSGPSGVGKDAVLARMKKSERPLHYVVTATTRPRRAREKDGVDYHFLSQEKFQRMVSERHFLEWAEVYGNYYGVPEEEITSALLGGLDVIVKVDVQGAATIKEILPQAVLIFLMPPSVEELGKRLNGRRSECSEDLALRLRRAKEEMQSLPLFDYVITSHQDKLDDVVAQIDAIIAAEKRHVGSRTAKL
jgi:guanylate kinase